MNIMIGIIIILLFGLYSFISERVRFNNGICKETGDRWEYFDTDSQGGRVYKSGDFIIWVTWPGIDKRRV